MPILVRRISRAKWDNVYENGDVDADAITQCLRTTNNELSTWLIDDINEIEKAILALVSGGKQENLNTIHIIYFDEADIQNAGLELKITAGDTVAKELIEKHRDISELTYSKLASVKNIVLDCLEKDRFKTVTKGEIKGILLKSIEDNILKLEDLHEKLSESLTPKK